MVRDGLPAKMVVADYFAEDVSYAFSKLVWMKKKRKESRTWYESVVLVLALVTSFYFFRTVIISNIWIIKNLFTIVKNKNLKNAPGWSVTARRCYILEFVITKAVS